MSSTLLLDVRVDTPEAMDALVRLTQDELERIAWVCESERTLRWLLERVPGAVHGPSWRRGLACLARAARSTKSRAPIWMIPERLGPVPLTPIFMPSVRAEERVWVWVVDDPTRARAVQRQGATGVFTAYPERLLRDWTELGGG